MTVRRATADDLGAITALVQDQRIRQHAWDPDYWAPSVGVRGIDPLLLRLSLTDGGGEALVSGAPLPPTSPHRRAPRPRGRGFERHGGRDTGAVDGVVIGAPLPLHGEAPTTWLIERIEVARPAAWASLGPVLLAAFAERARRHGAERIVVGCGTDDRHRRAAFAGAGLEVNCWYRHVDLDRVVAGAPVPEEVASLPLPRVHGLSSLSGRMTGVGADGAHALLSPSVAHGPADRAGGTCGVADPVVATHDRALVAVMEALEDRCRERGDRSLIVALSPGEEPLDAALEARGYGRPVEWWSWSPTITLPTGRTRSRTAAQEQPLVEPHS